MMEWNPIARNLVVLCITAVTTVLLGVFAVFGKQLVDFIIGSEVFKPFTWIIISIICAVVFGIVELVIRTRK